MQTFRMLCMAVVMGGGLFLTKPGTAQAAPSQFCGLCYQGACPSQPEAICNTHCGGFDGGGPFCVASPVCHEIGTNGMMLACTGNIE